MLIVDDHPILASGIKTLIETGGKYKVTDLAVNYEEALSLIKNKNFDILIVDYSLPGKNGLDLIKTCKKNEFDAKIVMLSMHDDPAVIKEITDVGVDAYILKKDTHLNLLKALDQIIMGRKFVSEEVLEILMEIMTKQSSTPKLTPRELEILKLISIGKSTKEISRFLFISERTVETHRKNINRKTGSGSAAELINWARKNDLI